MCGAVGKSLRAQPALQLVPEKHSERGAEGSARLPEKHSARGAEGDDFFFGALHLVQHSGVFLLVFVPHDIVTSERFLAPAWQ